MRNAYCAIDLGATSGRVIISTDGIGIEEIHRFPNSIYVRNNQYFWDTDRLLEEIRTGLRQLALRKDLHIQSIGVDAWGVDVIYVDCAGRALAHPRAYRDPYTDGAPEALFKHLSRSRIYEKTGVQFLNFNTLFQFYASHMQHYAPFEQADNYLFIPDYVSYKLTGRMVCEYTILSTSQMLNARTRVPDRELVEVCGARMECFPPMVMPGERIGSLLPEIADFGYEVPVIAVAGHDTASAVAAVPRMNEGKHIAYLSSGTWSLMGIVTDEPVISPESERMNFTNEGGIGGTVRLLKNITGMWILEQCRKEWAAEGKIYDHGQLIEMAQQVTEIPTLFNPDEERFANPVSMLSEVRGGHAMSDAEVTACIFRSLAARYGQVFGMLQQLAPWPIGALCIIGGGARNTFLNRLTEQAVGVPVIVGPTEATALGNIRVQMMKAHKQTL